ncbi:MAG: FecR domain-containing protein [Myxococcota bacterium]
MNTESRSSCPSFEALSSAFSEGRSAELAHHLEGCEACRGLLEDLAALKSAGQALPWSPPDPSSEAERAAVLVERAVAAKRSASRVELQRRVVGIAAAMAASVAVGYLIADRPQPGAGSAPLASAAPLPSVTPAVEAAKEEPRATVRGARGAQFVHEKRAKGEERVELSEGQLTLEVEPLQRGERFVVSTPDGEIETVGGVLEVSVDAGRLRSVAVISGRAEVRAKHGPPAPIAAGERWPVAVAALEPVPAATPMPMASPVPLASPMPAATPAPSAAPVVRFVASPPSPAAAKAPEPEASPLPTPAAAPEASASAPPASAPPESPTPAIPVVTDAERTFTAGWDALLASDFEGAAARFKDLEDKRDPLAEDAAYWRAVALGRAGRTADAELAMERYVARYPSSSRVPEVSAMLGWSLLRHGAKAEARPWLERAKAEGNATVRASAEKGLAL